MHEHVPLVEDEPSVRQASREILTGGTTAPRRRHLAVSGWYLAATNASFRSGVCDDIPDDVSTAAVNDAFGALRLMMRVLDMSFADDAIVWTGVVDAGYPFLQKLLTPHELLEIRRVLDRKEEE